MATIQLRRSAVASAVPTTTQLALGELAINTYDGKLYLKKDNGTQSIVEIGGGSANISIGDTPPSSPSAGALWWDSTQGKLKIYYNDGTSSQWVDASSNTYGSGGSTGTVTSVAMTVPTGLSVSGTPITTNGTLALTLTAGYSIPTTASQTNWDTAYTDRLKWDGGSTGLTASTGRTSLGATTVGSNLFTLTNPTAVTFLRVNADNTVSALDAATFRTAIGAGTSSTTGTVTSVGGTGTVAGLTLTGTVTSSGNLTLGGTLSTPVSTINDSTTVGQNLVKLTNPTAVTFLRVNADNTVSALDAATFRTAIGAGTSSTTGTVTSVGGTGTVAGLTLTGTVTSSGNLTLGGTLSVTPSDFASQTANTFLSAPNGTAGTPTFRTIVAADLPNTAVTPGSYTNSNITVDAQGRITAASNGTGGGGTPAGSNTQIQYNNSGAFGASSDFTYNDGTKAITLGGTNPQFNIATSTSFPATNSGTLSYIAEDMAGRIMPGFLSPEQDGSIQPSIGRNRVYYWAPPGLNSVTAPQTYTGTTALSAVGSTAGRSFATTNILTRSTRLGYVSAATAGSLTSLRVTSSTFLTTGNGSGLGGFTYIFRFGVSDASTVSGARMFVGVSSTTGTLTNVEYSTLTNSFGLAQLSTDATQWYFVYGGSVAQTAVALGTSIGAPTLTNTVWELVLFCPHNSNGVIGYQLKNLSSGVIVKNSVTPGTPGTQTPANTTGLTVQIARGNNATALAVGIDFISLYIETDQ